MQRRKNAPALLLWSFLLGVSCSAPIAPGDGASDAGRLDGGSSDGGQLDDAGLPDGAGLTDAGLPDDAGSMEVPDAGLSDDAGTEGDAGHHHDGGHEADAGRDEDAGPRRDAGPFDAGSRACTSNTECMSSVSPVAEYCDGTTCTDEGTCVPRPVSCPPPGPGPAEPVCGCDGTTYSSKCEAEAAGVRVSSSGDCMEPDAGLSDGGDSDAGQCKTYSPLPCGAIISCACADGTTKEAGCAGPPTCADACCAYGGVGP